MPEPTNGFCPTCDNPIIDDGYKQAIHGVITLFCSKECGEIYQERYGEDDK